MKKKQLPRIILITVPLLLFILLAPLSCGQVPGIDEKIGVAVTILPQEEFVRSVGGNMVDIVVMVPPGASPHSYEPKPSQIAGLAGVKMYAKVGSGVDFELAWMDKLVAANQEMLVVDCAERVPLLETSEQESEHGGVDPHIWLSPRTARIMVQNIHQGLLALDPAHRDDYQANLDAYLGKITQLDQDIGAALAGVERRTIMAYHPVFNYFARDYNLEVLAIEQEGKEPTAVDLAHLIAAAREHKIRVIFASPQFNPQSARVIANEIGAEIVFMDPLAGDYVANLRSFLEQLLKTLE
ncbi:metal ABC transporter solute-binding protein, Zn/Mn family [Chloroflexota bacterium]